jgi:hypothetical protein
VTSTSPIDPLALAVAGAAELVRRLPGLTRAQVTFELGHELPILRDATPEEVRPMIDHLTTLPARDEGRYCVVCRCGETLQAPVLSHLVALIGVHLGGEPVIRPGIPDGPEAGPDTEPGR